MLTKYQLGFEKLLIVDRFNPRDWAAPGFKTSSIPSVADDAHEQHGNTVGYKKNGRYRSISKKMLADFVEAILGAYCSDDGFETGIRLLDLLGMVSQQTRKALPTVLVATDDRKADDFPKPTDANSAYSDRWFDEIEEIISYKFKDRSILKTAFTHRSCRSGTCYERLEFLGDALMDWLITRYLFNTHRYLDAGRLSDIRGASVNNDCLSLLSVGLNFHKYLLHNSTSLQQNIDAYLYYLNTLKAKGGFVGSGMSISVASMADSYDGGSGFTAPKVLGDLFESVAAAVLVDSNWNVNLVWEVLEPLVSQYLEEHATPNVVNKSCVRQIHEHFQGGGFGVNDIVYK